ncbi:MAG: hypothetical protein WCA93_12695, partial [Acidimicrobiia bacterium]
MAVITQGDKIASHGGTAHAESFGDVLYRGHGTCRFGLGEQTEHLHTAAPVRRIRRLIVGMFDRPRNQALVGGDESSPGWSGSYWQ